MSVRTSRRSAIVRRWLRTTKDKTLVKKLARWLLRWDSRTDEQRDILQYRVLSALANLICLFPLRLSALLQLFGSDKQRPGWHRYGDTYARLFFPLKYRRLKLLEIGIGGYMASLGGRSLLAWQAYFPFAAIVAGDIVPKQALAGWRRHIHTLDQSSPEILNSFAQQAGPFDIIIDDGSHLNAHQILTFKSLFRHLRDNGLYIIEDVQTSFWRGIVGDVEWDGAAITDADFGTTCVGYFVELTKYINHTEFLTLDGLDKERLSFAKQIKSISFVHNLIIIRKGDNMLPSRFVTPRQSAGHMMAVSA